MNAIPGKRSETAVPLPSWTSLNRQWLIEAVARLLTRLEAGAEASEAPADCVEPYIPSDFVPALVHGAAMFGLSAFERELLLLLVGVELDVRLRRLVTELNPLGAGRPSFALALSLLVEPHWDALSPEAPLRRWGMLQLEPGRPLADAALFVDEHLVHYVAGVAARDPIVEAYAATIEVEPDVAGLGAQPVVLRAERLLRDAAGEQPIIVLDGGGDAAMRRDHALAAIGRSGHRLALWMAAGGLPTDPGSLTSLARRLEREMALSNAGLVLAVEQPQDEAAGRALLQRLECPLLWLGGDGAGALAALPVARRVIRLTLPRRDGRANGAVLAEWLQAGAGSQPAVRREIERAGSQFRLGPAAISSIIDEIASLPPAARPEAVWSAARSAARGGLEHLARRIDSKARLDDVVLPAGQRLLLGDIARQLRQRDRVYDEWGFGTRSDSGRGLVALFAGESGTGKTLAAEAIANEVELDLYRVDLATVISKYIGETEKNLKQIFDAAEASGAVLLFDEADAIFGKRSEVKDSHDRYANIEIAYLLQQVEAYRGLAILTTNFKSALDRAFMRRIRFVISFPFPDAAAREQIWRRQFPREAPVGEIDFRALAQLSLAGGNIRSIALNAAFKAADAGEAISQPILVAAAREEFAKLERSFGTELARGVA
ncbi:MAG TPA: ATP-binding protein [Devosia sp.]|jgi:hypothetical protein|uniref:ATP-binding protein n=1 Tax=Devosia sp. TaxID=1871048 RepID=UPI002DDD9315|nr:ATP-binding protein [Devosia sp.]HEV2517977.1 ATP-binding protein [Devosia sp.]